MKICPIAVWSAEILKNDNANNKKLYQEVINADSKIIHSEELTGACIFVYSATIAHLINNRADPDKAKKALDFASALAKEEMCNVSADNGEASATNWIEHAKKLWNDSKTASEHQGWIYNAKGEQK